jgi:hypothetical protein
LTTYEKGDCIAVEKLTIRAEKSWEMGDISFSMTISGEYG